MRWLDPAYRQERLWIAVTVLGLLWGVPLLLFLYVMIEIPSFERLENPAQDLASVALSADGEILGTFYYTSDRVRIAASEVPPIVKNALIAVEDRRFYDHAGIDPWGITAAVFSSLLGKPRGGSTITQQLARNLYDEVGVKRSLWRKLKEIFVAIYLEYRYSKEEILAMYLNTVPFGGVTYGIQAASRYYFGKDTKELSLSEAALLIGLLKGPSYYSPYKYPKRALARRNTVIDLMVEANLVSAAEASEAKKAPLGVGAAPYTASQSQGLAPYFREYLRLWLLQWARQRGYDLYRDGLRIYTTIDSRLQMHAESAVVRHMRDFQPLFDKDLATYPPLPWKRDTAILWRAMRRSERYNALKSAGVPESEIIRQFHQPVPMRLFTWQSPGYIDTVLTPWDSLAYYLRFLEVGLVTIDPHTGEIKAWVGGINHTFFKYDHVAQARRQVGSTFKPFVYTAAMDNGYSPCHEELNLPIEIYDDRDTTTRGVSIWAPQNADRSISGKVTLKQALALSLNLVTARLMKALGPEVVISYARRMGIQSDLEPLYPIGLGVSDLSLLELTSAYGCFPTLGVWREPVFIREIRDRRGNLIESFTSVSRRAISEQTAYLMVDMLRWVTIAGTASELRWRYGLSEIDIGGKTGTTQQHADGWFVGFTPDYVTGVWVGTADRAVHFHTMLYGQGARMAMPIWGLYMKSVYSDSTMRLDPKKRILPPAKFVFPDCQRAQAQELPEDASTIQDYLR
ncbi:MAG: PBP1A family penicillin-binding protein [Bacteroidia bacterium]|nr:PBP1A family penicillin-binding protein [Bacteroidia bacterium]MDW8417494.1 PBP1A family penicillin-binding protein [Bacteroidia bacterium]